MGKDRTTGGAEPQALTWPMGHRPGPGAGRLSPAETALVLGWITQCDDLKERSELIELLRDFDGSGHHTRYLV